MPNGASRSNDMAPVYPDIPEAPDILIFLIRKISAFAV
jgi:hypothetical protein